MKGVDWVKEKAKKAGDFITSDGFENIMNVVGTGANLLLPGAGTALMAGGKALASGVKKAKDVADKVSQSEMFKKGMAMANSAKEYAEKKLSKRPNELHKRVELKGKK